MSRRIKCQLTMHDRGGRASKALATNLPQHGKAGRFRSRERSNGDQARLGAMRHDARAFERVKIT
jgi:hypothetical protein